MDLGYGFPSMGRGRIWRDDHKRTMALQYQNAEEESYNIDIQNPFGITPEPWRLYKASTSGSDDPLITPFKFQNDDELEEEENVSFQHAQATKNVINILSGTCSYLTDTDNLSTSTLGEEADQIFPSFGDIYNSSTSKIAKHHKQGAVAATSTVSDEKSSSVNKLEEVSKCKKLPAPSYSLVSTKQTAKGFVALCEFMDYVETGCGNSQKEAREEAAIKMLKNLHIGDASSEYDYDFGHSFQYNVINKGDGNGLLDKTKNEYKAPHIQVSNSNFKGLVHCQRDQFQQKADSGSDYKFPEFSLKPTGNKQYVWLLQSIASKMNFKVRYEIVPHRTSNSLAQCLVHLCKDPPIVCYGSAKSENKAKSSAARCAFEYLKIVYQK